MSTPYGRGIPLGEARDIRPSDYDFREGEPSTGETVPDTFPYDEVDAIMQERAAWFAERGVLETDVLRDKVGEFYYDPNEDENGSVRYVKRRLPQHLHVIF